MLSEFKEGSVVQVSARMKASTDEASSRVFLNAAEVGGQLGLRKSRVYALAAARLAAERPVGTDLVPCWGIGRRSTSAASRPEPTRQRLRLPAGLINGERVQDCAPHV
jgi:hypothetical protein